MVEVERNRNVSTTVHVLLFYKHYYKWLQKGDPELEKQLSLAKEKINYLESLLQSKPKGSIIIKHSN